MVNVSTAVHYAPGQQNLRRFFASFAKDHHFISSTASKSPSPPSAFLICRPSRMYSYKVNPFATRYRLKTSKLAVTNIRRQHVRVAHSKSIARRGCATWTPKPWWGIATAVSAVPQPSTAVCTTRNHQNLRRIVACTCTQPVNHPTCSHRPDSLQAQHWKSVSEAPCVRFQARPSCQCQDDVKDNGPPCSYMSTLSSMRKKEPKITKHFAWPQCIGRTPPQLESRPVTLSNMPCDVRKGV